MGRIAYNCGMGAAITVAEVERRLAAAPQPLRTPAMRGVARELVGELREAEAAAVLELSEALAQRRGWLRSVGFELAARHRPAAAALDWRWLERLGATLDGWDSVDHFARLLSGPAWQRGQLTDARVLRWARSQDMWRRRAAIVSTIALNERQLGAGDAARTLAVCDLFIDAREDLIVKALSWALRELGIRDAPPVREWLTAHEPRLHPRIPREVRKKLDTGSKVGRPSERMRQRWQPRC